LIDAKDQALLKKIIEAIQFCLEQKQVVKQEVLAVVLQQLVDTNPIPPLLMRTMIQTLARYPKITPFIMNLLTRLITKQVWNDKRLWEGIVKCCKMALPHSLPILTQLPAPQLESALKMQPDLKDQLLAFAKKENITLKINLQ